MDPRASVLTPKASGLPPPAWVNCQLVSWRLDEGRLRMLGPSMRFMSGSEHSACNPRQDRIVHSPMVVPSCCWQHLLHNREPKWLNEIESGT